jgi:hypothetical protein
MIKSRRMRWAPHVARKEEMINPYKILDEHPKVRRPLKRVGVDGRIILKFVLWI